MSEGEIEKAADPPERRGGRKKNGRFGPGNSYGRGSPHARYQAELRTAMLEATTKEDVVSVLGVLKSLALVGDKDAARLYLEHTVGKARETPLDWVDLKLPPLSGPDAFSEWHEKILDATTSGNLPLSMAEKLSEMAENARRAYETQEMAIQLADIEARQKEIE